MALRQEKTVINGNTYEVTSLVTSKSNRALIKVMPMMTAIVAFLKSGDVQGFGAITKDGDAAADNLEEVLQLLAGETQFTPAGSNQTVLLSTVYELHFSANQLELAAWAKFAMGVNWESFFLGMIESLGKMQTVTDLATKMKAAKSTPSPKAKAG